MSTDIVEFLQPIIPAAVTGLSWAWIKYRTKIFDPAKETPEKFDWVNAGETALIAIAVSIVYTLMGNPLGVDGIESQMAIYGGATAILDPVIKGAVRWVQEKWRGEKE
jgi:hypothetical protein